VPHTDVTSTLLPNPTLPSAARGSKKNAALHTPKKGIRIVAGWGRALRALTLIWGPNGAQANG
jgi:hypothetical protein